jgi:DNA-binding LacI/PurR family transcriptional regulator
VYNALLGARRTTLKAVASRLGLTPGTVSATLNNSPAAKSIPEHTKKRILAAAKENVLTTSRKTQASKIPQARTKILALWP